VSDFDLPKPVRTTGSPMKVFIRTAGEAIDAIQALEVDMQRQPHWSKAEHCLHQANESGAQSDLKVAHQAFEQALSKEKWLYKK
jgi:hypothetical protein